MPPLGVALAQPHAPPALPPVGTGALGVARDEREIEEVGEREEVAEGVEDPPPPHPHLPPKGPILAVVEGEDEGVPTTPT